MRIDAPTLTPLTVERHLALKRRFIELLFAFAVEMLDVLRVT